MHSWAGCALTRDTRPRRQVGTEMWPGLLLHPWVLAWGHVRQEEGASFPEVRKRPR